MYNNNLYKLYKKFKKYLRNIIIKYKHKLLLIKHDLECIVLNLKLLNRYFYNSFIIYIKKISIYIIISHALPLYITIENYKKRTYYYIYTILKQQYILFSILISYLYIFLITHCYLCNSFIIYIKKISIYIIARVLKFLITIEDYKKRTHYCMYTILKLQCIFLLILILHLYFFLITHVLSIYALLKFYSDRTLYFIKLKIRRIYMLIFCIIERALIRPRRLIYRVREYIILNILNLIYHIVNNAVVFLKKELAQLHCYIKSTSFYNKIIKPTIETFDKYFSIVIGRYKKTFIYKKIIPFFKELKDVLLFIIVYEIKKTKFYKNITATSECERKKRNEYLTELFILSISYFVWNLFFFLTVYESTIAHESYFIKYHVFYFKLFVGYTTLIISYIAYLFPKKTMYFFFYLISAFLFFIIFIYNYDIIWLFIYKYNYNEIDMLRDIIHELFFSNWNCLIIIINI